MCKMYTENYVFSVLLNKIHTLSVYTNHNPGKSEPGCTGPDPWKSNNPQAPQAQTTTRWFQESQFPVRQRLSVEAEEKF